MDQSILSQQLDMPQVDLPPEDTNNLSRLVPELDLLDDKGKDKDQDDSEEEVRRPICYRTCFDQNAQNSVISWHFLFPPTK